MAILYIKPLPHIWLAHDKERKHRKTDRQSLAAEESLLDRKVGRARAGTTRGPIWRGGSVTFAAQPRDHIKKLNKKMYQSALRSVLSELVRQDRIVIVKKNSF